jgi:hypothetical protein
MARCPSCDYPLSDDRASVGARCPNCRDPLYESTRPPRAVHPGEAACVAHPANEAGGTCARCGNYLCEVCRTRWRDQLICTACIDRALESKEAAPDQKRGQRRQAILGVVLGGTAWVVAGLGILLAAVGVVVPGRAGLLLRVIATLVLLAVALLALFGVGQAATALRTRGDHMILATIGLVVSGLYVGLLLGLFAVGIYTTP